MITGSLKRIRENLHIYKQVCQEEEKKEDWWPSDYPFHPEEKQCHYWIHGEPNTGKSTILSSWMKNGAKVFFGPYNNDWFGFNSKLHEIVVFDAYRGQLTI